MEAAEHVFQDLCALTGGSYNLATKDQPEYVDGQRRNVPRKHQMVGLPLLMGRYFLPEEGVAGRDHVVILTYKLWRKLGANPHIVGTTLRLNDEPYTVVGVEQDGAYAHGEQAQIILPLVFKPEQINHDFHWLTRHGPS